ncbi:MAG: hypothetical protein ACRDZX_00650 [Acidimicrobiales bacterium]
MAAAFTPAGTGPDNPDECFFLRTPSGVFTHYLTCGGAFFDGYCEPNCGGADEVDFVLAVAFKLAKEDKGWEGEGVRGNQSSGWGTRCREVLGSGGRTGPTASSST